MAAQQPLDGLGGADLGLPVRAFNRSDEPIVWEYARAKHVLAPGVQTFVPYMAMVYWQGDPRSINLPGDKAHEQHRRLERERLRVLYGVYENEERWADLPLVECYPIDSDVRFETVLHDPDGASLSEQTQTNNQVAFMQQELESMAQKMRVMQGQIEIQRQAEGALDVADMDPEDLDRQETTHRTVTPEEATGQSMVGPAPTRKTAPKAKAAAAVTRDGE